MTRHRLTFTARGTDRADVEADARRQVEHYLGDTPGRSTTARNLVAGLHLDVQPDEPDDFVALADVGRVTYRADVTVTV